MSIASSVFRAGLFRGKVAIVSGGGTGIGRAITRELAGLDCKVIIASRSLEKVTKASEELCAELKREDAVVPFRCNIRKEEDVKALMEMTVEKYGGIDFLVNNGGGQFPSPAAAIRTKGWNAVIDTNLTGTFLMCREAYTTWMAEHGGSIVTITADTLKGFPGMSHTGAARAGVDNLTKSLAVEWAGSGVRINTVQPGIIYSATAAANYEDPDLFKSYVPNVPVKRLGSVEEVSSAVTFLLSPGAAYITGATLRIDGASSLGGCAFPLADTCSLPVYGTLPPFAKL